MYFLCFVFCLLWDAFAGVKDTELNVNVSSILQHTCADSCLLLQPGFCPAPSYDDGMETATGQKSGAEPNAVALRSRDLWPPPRRLLLLRLLLGAALPLSSRRRNSAGTGWLCRLWTSKRRKPRWHCRSRLEPPGPELDRDRVSETDSGLPRVFVS